MSVYFDFSTYLGLATLAAGIIWAVDAAVFKKQRVEKNQNLIDKYGLKDVQANKVMPDELDEKIKALDLDPMTLEQAPRMSKLADYAQSFFPVLLLVFVLRAFIAEPFRIPSGSMRPGLIEGDFILVNKFAYGLRFPTTGTKLAGDSNPHRGDVMVFRNPRDTTQNYIKRVVGLPGDKVRVQDKIIYINDKPVALDYIETTLDKDMSGATRKVKHYKETLNSITHSIYVEDHESGDMNETVVPDGHYFVMGDNRDMSLDSRVWGFVPDELILGRAFFIWLSLDSNNWIVRWSRFGPITDKE